MKRFRKTLLYVLPVVAALSVFSSCSDYIDIDTENSLDVNAIDYTQTADMYKPVIGCYARMRDQGIHWANCMLWLGRDDDMSSGRADDQGDALKFGYPGGYVNPSGFWAVNNLWVTMYNIIIDCNSNLEALDNYGSNLSEGTADYQKYMSYRGEIRTIRAWAYYQLVTVFGPCVIYADNNQVSFYRSTVEKVYDYVINDLEEAIPYMEAKRPNQMEHAGAYSKYTAEALAARFALLKGDYEKVETLTDDIITKGGFSLYNDYYNLFKIPGKLCDESLMEVQVTDFGNDGGDYIGVDQWFNFRGAGLLKANRDWLMGGWTFMRYNPAFLRWAEERGETVRRQTSFLVAGETTPEGYIVNGTLNMNAQIAEIYDGKAYLPKEQMTGNSAEWGRNNNVRVIRYAEVLLMNAEAKVRQGKSGDASFNLVRTRAQMPTLSNVTVDQILDERRMELCAEWGLRYTDLCRTGLAQRVLGPYGWTEKARYVDIPSNQILLVPDLAADPQ